jgi:hypothetical protein
VKSLGTLGSKTSDFSAIADLPPGLAVEVRFSPVENGSRPVKARVIARRQSTIRLLALGLASERRLSDFLCLATAHVRGLFYAPGEKQGLRYLASMQWDHVKLPEPL